MAKIKFDYNLQKDVWSWVLIAKDMNAWGLDWREQVGHIPDELLKKIEKASFSRAEKIVEEYIRKNPKKAYKNKVMQIEMKALEKIWRSVEGKYFSRLAKLTNKPIYCPEFRCYFTTGLMCPYNEKENWFMASMWHSIPASITTICHEIMHLQFLHYYRDHLKKKGLKNDQIEDLKESLTFLLNDPEFDQIILCQDNGYPDHFALRKKLQNIWEQNRNFQELVEAGIKIK
jgi:hypothetical protein